MDIMVEMVEMLIIYHFAIMVCEYTDSSKPA